MDLGHWELADGVTLPEDFEENPPMGFVYRIENKETKKFYIGQKKIIKVEKRPPLKGKVRKRKIIKQSDWRTYCGSSNDLKVDVKALGEDKFKFEIIKFCDCKWLMTYWELYYQMINHVLFREDSYNGIINVRISKFQKFIDMYQQENQNLDKL
jgi:hypothetical protein